MREFHGWMPETIDNLTFDQLEVIFTELDKYRKLITPLEVAFEDFKQVIFKYIGVKTKKKTKDDKLNLSGIPSAKMTKDEIQAWAKTGYKGPASKFVANYGKK